MARVLSSELATALDRDEHQPCARLLSSDIEAAIPFDGNPFNFSNEKSWRPHMITHSNGNIYAVARDVQNGDATQDLLTFIIINTDDNTIEKLQPSINTAANGNIDKTAVVEMPDGNLGIIMARYGLSDSTGSIYSAILSEEGNVIQSPTQIGTYPRASSGSYGLTGLSIALFSDGTYYLVYCYTTNDDETSFELYKLTSSDFSSWTGPTAISHGLDTAETEMEGVYVFETEENDCFLLFSYTDIIEGDVKVFNIYSMLSTDYGSTWGAAEARTTYTDLGSSVYSPVLVQKSDGTLYMAFYESSNVLRLSNDALGWQDSSFYDCPAGFNVKTIYYNPSTGHITCSYGRPVERAGVKCTCGVLLVDPETWTILKNYNEYSSPALNGFFADDLIEEHKGECAAGSKFLAADTGNSHMCIMILDVEAGSLEHVVIARSTQDPYSGYGLSRTLDADPSDFPNRTQLVVNPTFKGIGINEDNADELYIVIADSNYDESYFIMKIPIDDPDEYSFIENAKYGTNWDPYELSGLVYITAYDNDNIILLGSGSSLGYGAIVVRNKTTGALIGEWRTTSDPSFPKFGCSYCKPTYYNGHVYFNIKHSSSVSYENQRGLCDINVSTGLINTIRPSWSTSDNYYLYGHYAIDTINNQIWIAPHSSSQSGDPNYYVTAARYDINSGVWTIYTKQTLPGIPNTYTVSSGQNITIDEENGNIYMGLGSPYNTALVYPGIMAFNISNDFTQVKYLNAVKDASWTWEEDEDISDLVISTSSANPAMAIDDNDVIWGLWDNYSFVNGVYTPNWDRDMGDVNVVDYLVGQIRAKWELKASSLLEFELSHGHLFDPNNYYSILRDIVRKGRILNLSIGEIYNGTAMYEEQGKFIVTEVRLNYGRGKYPTIKVKAEGLCSIWKEQDIITTDLYSASPNAMITDLITTHGQLAAGEYDIPTLESTHDVEHQFVDMSLWDAIEDICDHWFYVPYDDMDGIFTLLYIDLDRNIDHIYSDNKKVTDFSPDDTYSDFTNSIRVIGETDDLQTRIYEEELVGTLAGTIGWWENKQTRKLSYSQDGSYTRKCRYPRLEIIQSIQYQGPLMDAIATDEGEEYISYEDTNETYVEITIDVPDLTAAVIVSVTTMLALGVAAVGCDGLVTGGCGVVIMALTIDIAATMYILMAVANYQYEIYAQPLGEEKESIEYTLNDTEHQRMLSGRIVRKDIDDPFCYSVSECRRVAEGNLAIIQAQRSRIKFKKVAHMQDEIGDKIQVNHPYSGEELVIFVTSIVRTYKKGKDKSSGMFDEIEGWRII